MATHEQGITGTILKRIPLAIATLLALPQLALAQDDAASPPAPPPPAWMLDGLRAAVMESKAQEQAGIAHLAQLPSVAWLLAGAAQSPQNAETAATLLAATMDFQLGNYFDLGIDTDAALAQAPDEFWTEAWVQSLLRRIDPQFEPYPSVRIDAAELLALMPEHLWSPEVLKAVLGALDNENDNDARLAMISALSGASDALWTPDFTALQLSRLDRAVESSWIRRDSAARLLAQAPPSVWNEALVAALLRSTDRSIEDDVDVQAAATFALGYAPPELYTRLVTDLSARLDPLQDWDWKVRAAAATALGNAPANLWSDTSIRNLARSMDPEFEVDYDVNEAARQALAKAPANAWSPGFVSGLVAELNPQLEGSTYVRRNRAATLLALVPPGAWSDGMARAVARSLDSRVEDDLYVREAVANALGQRPAEIWSPGLLQDHLGLLDPQNDLQSRLQVAALLARAPEQAWTVDTARTLLDRLAAEEYPELLEAAVPVLGKIPDQAWSAENVQAQAGYLDFTRELDAVTRQKAAILLGQIPDRMWTEEIARILLDAVRLGSGEGYLLNAAVSALEEIPDHVWSPGFAGYVLAKLDETQESDWVTRETAAKLLGGAPQGIWTPELVQALVRSLHPAAESDYDVRAAAATALANAPAGMWSPAVMEALLAAIDPEIENTEVVRMAATVSLASAPEDQWSTGFMQQWLDTVEREQSLAVRTETELGLRRMQAGLAAQQIASWYVGIEQGGVFPALETLVQSAPAGAVQLLPLLENLMRAGYDQTPRYRAMAHILSGAKGEGATALQWLGRAPNRPLDAVTNDPIAAFVILSLLNQWRSAFPAEGPLLEEAHEVVGEIASAACQDLAADPEAVVNASVTWLKRLPFQGVVQPCWTADQQATMEELADWIRATNRAGALNIDQQLESGASASMWRLATGTAVGWVVFWLAFVLLFPTNPTVQAVFLFNPKARQYFSLGVVPLLLLLVPALRRSLLKPFREDLLAEARLADLPALAFFGEVPAAQDSSEQTQPVQALFADIRGLVVLRGEAGLGKTSVLRWYVSQTRRPMAFLHARDCAAGVAEAVTGLMKGISDTDFVRSLVHAGSLGVIIDGLNEVSADTRELIRNFAAQNRRACIFIGTQPIEWLPPAGAKEINLRPLPRAASEKFLLSRPVGAAAAPGVNYAESVRRFLQESLDGAQSEEERKAAQVVLSNPFDLALAADLIAAGKAVNATSLIDAAFSLAAGPGPDSYHEVNNRPFPLAAFSLRAVEMREQERNWFEEGEFEAERPCLLDHKLLIKRAVRSGLNTTVTREMFRHDRVWDFFIAAAFERDRGLLEKYIGDPRFRGAYLRIAVTWPVPAAMAVRDMLVVHASRTNDNTTSNEFVRRLQPRLTALPAAA